MDDFNQRGTLPKGVKHDGKRCRKYTLVPMRVKEQMAARKHPDAATAADDEQLRGLLAFAVRLKIDGVPSEAMTLDFMSALFAEDMNEIFDADERLQKEVERFLGEDEAQADVGAGADGNALEES